MADGVSIKGQNLEKHLAQLRNLAPTLDMEIEKASKKNAEEHAALAKQLSPGGDYGETIEAKRDNSIIGRVVWGVWARFDWLWFEHGTAPGPRVEKTGKRAGTVVNHPGTPARPHFDPSYRLLRKRTRGRMKRAMTKAAKGARK